MAAVCDIPEYFGGGEEVYTVICLAEIRKLKSTKAAVNHIYVLKINRLTMTSMLFVPPHA